MKPNCLACRVLVTVALVFGLLNSAPTTAQGTGTISGTVSDEAGNIVSGATVTITQTATGAVRTLTADGQGRYVAAGLAPGTYTVRTEQADFETAVRRGIEVTLGSHVVIDTALTVGSVEEEIVVTAGISGIDKVGSTLGGLVDERTIRELPLNARSFVQLTTLEAGVSEFKNVGEPTTTYPGSGRGLRIAANGIRPEMNNYLIDGIDVGDAYNNSPGSAAGLFLGVETLREFQVLTSTYPAEFGRVGGAVINAVTRSGDNELKGWAFEFHRNDSLNAKNFFDGDDKPDFDRDQFGLGFSGPLVSDKTFFLVSYEGLREDLGRTIVSVVPDDAARQGILPDPANPGGTIVVPVHPSVRPYLDLYPRANRDTVPGDGVGEFAFAFNQPTEQDFLTAKIDHRFNDSQSLSARGIVDDASVLRPLNFPQFGVDETSDNQFYAVELQSVLSGKHLNTARVGLSKTEFASRDVERTPIDPSLSFIDGKPFGTIIVGGLTNLGITTFGPSTTPAQDLLSFSDQLTLIRGRHTIKVGGSYRDFEINEQNSLIDNGLWNFFSLGNFLQNRPFAFLGLQPTSIQGRETEQSLLGLFVQDDIRIGSNFTLNLGLRYEDNSVPTEANGLLSNLRNPTTDADPTVGGDLISDANLDNIAPRIGFSWVPTKSGKLAIRGGYGLFYHQLGYGYFFRALQYTPPFGGFGALPAPPVGPPFVAFPRIPPQFFPANLIFPLQFDIETPYVAQFNLNVQRELPANMVLTVAYVGSRGRHLGRVTEINTFRPRDVGGEPFFVPGPRVNPNWVGLNVIDTNGSSWYDSLQVSLAKSFSDGYSFQASYTYGDCEDNAPPLLRDVDSAPSIVMDANNPDRDRGRCNSDIEHNFTLHYTWQLPFGRNATGAKKRWLDGWQISGVTSIRSGSPFTVENAFDRARTGKLGPFLTDRPDVNPGVTDVIQGGPIQYFNPNAFALQPAGFYGNSQRNGLEGPGLQNWDVSIVKNTPLADGVNLQIRLDVFNLFNHTNFSVPTGPGRIAFLGATPGPGAPGIPNPVAGRIFSTVTPARQLQLAAKLTF
ncbi:MAG: TonB-dependent receptor [Acidobacteriota bacterium]